MQEEYPPRPHRLISDYARPPLKSFSVQKVPKLSLQISHEMDLDFPLKTLNQNISPVSSNILKLQETARSSLEQNSPHQPSSKYLVNMDQYRTTSNLPF